jgi:hypothetical protein
MKKAATLLAVAGLAMATEDFSDDFFAISQQVIQGNPADFGDVKHVNFDDHDDFFVAQQVIQGHPADFGFDVKTVNLDDDHDDFFVSQQVVQGHPADFGFDVKTVNLDDDELFSFKDAGHAIGTGISKTGHFIKDHPAVIRDGINIGRDIATRNVPRLVIDGIKTYHDIRHDDEEFFVDTHSKKDKVGHSLGDLKNLIKESRPHESTHTKKPSNFRPVKDQ